MTRRFVHYHAIDCNCPRCCVVTINQARAQRVSRSEPVSSLTEHDVSAVEVLGKQLEYSVGDDWNDD